MTMAVPFMRAYCELLVKTCHRRGAHAMGGMAAFIPSRRDPEVNAVALARVREDKEREAGQGFDGTWVAHPDLVAVATGGVRRRARQTPEPDRAAARRCRLDAAPLLDVAATPGDITDDGIRNNVSVGIQYSAAWLRARGRGDLQPDGGRRHLGDLPLTGMAMASPRAGPAADVAG